MTVSMPTGSYELNSSLLFSQDDHLVIEEDSLLLKVFSCVPIIGAFVSSSREISLKSKIENSFRTKDIIDLLKVKNSYTKVSLIRNIFITAVVIRLLYRSIIMGLSLSFVGFLTVCSLGLTALPIYKLVHNSGILKKLESEKNEKPFQPKLFRDFEVL